MCTDRHRGLGKMKEKYAHARKHSTNPEAELKKLETPNLPIS